MKKLLIITLALINLASFAQIKVACVGNSITYGAGITNREKNSYPMQLQYRLGDQYEVQNFGISARTLLKKGNLPYVKTNEYVRSLEFNPDIVVIKLGTNDSKSFNLPYLESDFYNDYKELILSYRNVNPKARIILCKPVRCYLPDSVFSTTAYEKIIIPQIEKLGYDLDCEVANLYSVFDTQWADYIMPDKLHPSSVGAGMLADRIATIINNNKPAIEFKEGESFNFHGYKGLDFKMNGVDCKYVAPRHAAEGNPWVLRARFWGHEPQLDIDLLENGFAITYCDVANLYGSPKAVARWNDFYKFITSMGHSKKVVLEGMSRGGLIVYNWAAENPKKVACIYADAPVMDLNSWPIAVKWDEYIKNMMSAYGFKSIEEVKSYDKMPINHAKKLLQVPIIHVVGQADDIVPVANNTDVFEARYKALGGEMEIIRKPEVGHHPHSLKVPGQLTQFILKACGLSNNKCIQPLPGNEYRPAAGWTNGSDWHAVADEINELLSTQEYDLLLIGNSITQGFAGERKRVTHKPGKAVADSIFGNLKWLPAGISGDRTQHILWRLQNGNYAKANPKNVVITIGINNLWMKDEPCDVAKGIEAIAEEAKKQFPNAKIFILGPLPAGLKADDRLRIGCNETHKCLAKTNFKGVTYINPTDWFVNPDGSLKTECYGGDYLHLTTKGYLNWCEKIAEFIK